MIYEQEDATEDLLNFCCHIFAQDTHIYTYKIDLIVVFAVINFYELAHYFCDVTVCCDMVHKSLRHTACCHIYIPA